MEPGEHYRGQRHALSELFAGLDADQLRATVPGCPRWQVRDLLGHLVGLTVSVRTGDMADAGSPAWTQRQVDARRDRSVEDLLQEWGTEAPAFEDGLAGLGFLGWVVVYDVTLHGDDAREALGLPLGSSETHELVLDGIVARARTRADGLGTLTLHAGSRSWELGAGEPTASLTVPDEGELSRVVAARRSDDAVRAHAWTGDPEPWIDVLPLFRAGR
jgi:uncharacterized protein (TIGR03083 family)